MTPDQAEAALARVGPFWDGVEGRVPVPPAAATLGFGFVDAAADEITVSFEATPAFTNPMGEVLGAFQAAMLYDTVGPALLATLGPGEFIETLHLNVHFLNPTKPGRMIGVGRVVQRTGDMATLEGTLSTTASVLLATATAVARVVPAHVSGSLNQAPHQA
jgi:uncharacterized protein (TIGR00369 family)